MKQKKYVEINQPSVFEFMKRIPDEAAARAYIASGRWPNGVKCHHCGHDEVWTLKGGALYTCKLCRRQFTVRTGTVMEDSKIPLQKWIYAMYLMTVCRKSISSIQLAKELGITQKSAWHMAHRIREACRNSGLLSGTVEADETYVGGKEKNKHANKKRRAGRGAVGKAIVIGAKARNGEVRAMTIEGTTAPHFTKAVEGMVAKGSTLYTDEHRGYFDLMDYRHSQVNHSEKEYVRGDAHTNGIESFWAILKRAVMGTFHSVSKKHLPRYVREFTFKANTKGLPAFDTDGKTCGITTVRAFLAGMEGRRLQYNTLTANA